MATSINDRMVNEGGSLYYSPQWHLCIETHLAWLRSLPTNRLLIFEAALAYKYEGDLAGLLLESGIQPEYHWVIMRLNDMTSPTQYSGTQTKLLMPDLSQIEAIRAVFRTANKKLT